MTVIKTFLIILLLIVIIGSTLIVSSYMQRDTPTWVLITLIIVMICNVSCFIMWTNKFNIWWDKQLLSTHYNKLKDNQFKQHHNEINS